MVKLELHDGSDDMALDDGGDVLAVALLGLSPGGFDGDDDALLFCLGLAPAGWQMMVSDCSGAGDH